MRLAVQMPEGLDEQGGMAEMHIVLIAPENIPLPAIHGILYDPVLVLGIPVLENFVEVDGLDLFAFDSVGLFLGGGGQLSFLSLGDEVAFLLLLTTPVLIIAVSFPLLIYKVSHKIKPLAWIGQLAFPAADAGSSAGVPRQRGEEDGTRSLWGVGLRERRRGALRSRVDRRVSDWVTGGSSSRC